jgi:hypothetical protein
MTESRKAAVRRWSPVVLTSVAALSTAFLAGPAAAQSLSFNAGNPTVTSGSVTFDRGVTTPGTEVYTIDSRTAVLDFRPSETATAPGLAINFQNAGTTVRYTNGANTPTFTVLNRIIPADTSRPVQFNGRVISEIRNANTTAPGGEVWFYSPGGIVLGGTAAFDIGSLLLTTRDPVNGAASFAPGNSFRGGGVAGSVIDIRPGASINATSEGSYVALMAPQIRQSGNVRVNGSAAYVAAEDATVTINSGLFDITLATGTDTGGGFPINHSGSTGGPASTGAADHHRIYMVTMPKNTAITLLIGQDSRVGYDAATTVGVQNGRVVLSSGRMEFEGRSIVAGELTGSTGIASGGQPFAPAAADVHVYGNLSSSLFVRAWTNAYLATAGGSSAVAGDVYLAGGARAHIASRSAGAVTSISGNVTLVTDLGTVSIRQSGNQTVFDETAGESLIYAENGGAVTIGGAVTMRANANAIPFVNIGDGPLRSLAQGGRAHIFANGGTIRIDGNTSLSANAFAGSAAGAGPILTSDVRGGSAGVSTSQGGSIILGGALNALSASALASGNTSTSTFGGNTFFNINGGGGTIQAAGGVSLTSTAVDSGDVGGGEARGGTAGIAANGASIAIGGDVTMATSAFGGGDEGGAAGSAFGGNSTISTNAAGGLTIGGRVVLDASATGGAALGASQGNGGNATGGLAGITSGGTMRIDGAVTLVASGTGGQNARTGSAGGSGGLGAAGSTILRGTTGTATLGAGLTMITRGTGGSSTGAGGNGGNGLGGGSRLDTTLATARVSVAGATIIDASGTGGDGRGAGSRGGDGIAGLSDISTSFNRGAIIFAGNGSINLAGQATLLAVGRGGVGGTGGVGRGGLGEVATYDGAATIAGALIGLQDGVGGAGSAGGAGGDAVGGRFLINTFPRASGSGSVQLASTTLSATATGGAGGIGAGGIGGAGGAATGGFINSYAWASSVGVATGSLSMLATALGGAGGAGAPGFAGGAGGAAVGGQAQIGNSSGDNLIANSARVTHGAVIMSVNATGGAGGTGGTGAAAGVGGAGSAGSSVILVRGVPVTVGSVAMTAVGTGGAGSIGGRGAGGVTDIVASNRFERPERGLLTAGAVAMSSRGIGGAGPTAGAAVAGASFISVSGADVSLASLDLSNSGTANASGSNVLVDVAGGTLTLTRGTINTPGAVVINSREGGAIRSPSLSISASGLRGGGANGSIGVGLLDLGDLSLNISGGFVVDQPLRVSGALNIVTDGLFDLQTRLTGRTLSIASGGIVIGANGGLGDAQTQSIILASTGAMTLGGAPSTPSVQAAPGSSWLLTTAEASRLRANRIEFRAGVGQTLTVRDFSLIGSAGGANANLTGGNGGVVFAGDRVSVEGALILTGAGATDQLRLSGARSVAVVTDRNGSINLRGVETNGAGPLAGVLHLDAPVIGVGDSALLTQLLAEPRFSGRNALLAQASATPVPAGFVQASHMILTTSNVAAIQNTGTSAQFGGFTVGSLEVRAPTDSQGGGTPAQVVVYGRLLRGDGSFATGTEVSAASGIAPDQSPFFDRASLVNGCAFGSACGAEPATIVATVSAIEEVLAANQAAAVEVPAIRVVQIVDQEDLVVDPVITEPVSGAGNASLWGADESEDDDDAAAPSAGTPTVTGGQM